MIEPWRKLSSERLGDYRVFSVNQERKVSPRTGAVHDFYVIESPNWVNVIALTADGRIVMVEQFRQGSETVELEIPGGVMDAGDGSPEATGSRELLEETGFRGGQAQIIGRVYPNPAIMRNTCFTVLVPDCSYVKPVHFDEAEDIAVTLVALGDLPELVASGKIRHALIVAALCQFELWWRKNR